MSQNRFRQTEASDFSAAAQTLANQLTPASGSESMQFEIFLKTGILGKALVAYFAL
jgi:hypothetical protein